MKNIIFLCFFTLFVSACDSPMNNRVSDNGDASGLVLEKKSFGISEYKVEVKWLDGPYGRVTQDNYLLVFLYKVDRLVSLPETETLQFYATMPSMGHTLEDAGFFEEIETGIYLNKAIRFNMPGDWKNELWIMDSEFNIKDRLEWRIFF